MRRWLWIVSASFFNHVSGSLLKRRAASAKLYLFMNKVFLLSLTPLKKISTVILGGFLGDNAFIFSSLFEFRA